MKLKDKTAVVTGSGRGLGRAIALSFVKEGAKVALFSRTMEDLEETSARIREMNGEVLRVSGDVSKKEDADRLMEQTVKQFGTIDILVNNAAIIGPPRFLEDADEDSWLKTININLNGVYYCCRRAIPVMAEKGAGKIINVTSGLGQRPFPHFCAYGVSKAGVDQITRSLGEEFREKNIQVNSLDPGVMDTSMQNQIRGLSDKLRQDILRQFVGFHEKGQLQDPMEIAEVAVFLASSESDHITCEIVSKHDLARYK